MDFYTRLTAGLLFPLQERLKGHSTVTVRRDMEQTQWWSPEQLKALQVRRLKALLVDAAENVPYYSQLLAKRGIQPAAIDSLDVLQQLPRLTKEIIRVNTDAMKHRRSPGLTRFTTGGSTGDPLAFFIGKRRVSHDVAAKWRATRWWGVDIGDPEVVIWGSPIEVGAQDKVRALRDWIFRSTMLPAFEMTDIKLAGFLDGIRRERPRMLFGYPYSLAYIAQYAQRKAVKMSDLGIQVAFVTSETLYPQQRELISQVFGCPVANGYGGRDAGFIAHECPSGSLHITAEDVIVETLDQDGRTTAPDVAGEIVVTHLATNDFPFIRYRTGDIGKLGLKPCVCGRGLPVLQEIQGRAVDFLATCDGSAIPGGAFTYLIRETAGIKSFKIVQHTVAFTEVELLVDPSFNPSDIPNLIARFRQRLGTCACIEVAVVDHIDLEKSGKFRYITSKVSAWPKGPEVC